jgi:hypothetical protein
MGKLFCILDGDRCCMDLHWRAMGDVQHEEKNRKERSCSDDACMSKLEAALSRKRDGMI